MSSLLGPEHSYQTCVILTIVRGRGCSTINDVMPGDNIDPSFLIENDNESHNTRRRYRSAYSVRKGTMSGAAEDQSFHLFTKTVEALIPDSHNFTGGRCDEGTLLCMLD